MKPALPISVLAVAVAGVQAGQQPSARASFDEITKRAAEARQADKLEEAIQLYRQAVKLRPTYDEGWSYLGAITHRWVVSREFSTG